MEREIDLQEVSDGKRYGLNDMVRLGCNNCEGCCDCCTGMGNSIVLDPLDIYRLTVGLNCKFEELLLDKIDLNVVEGIILPNLKMAAEDGCVFLDKNKRCSIHQIRPGLCRIFPLGRVYEDADFAYFLQVHECKRNRTKVKVMKWIDTEDVAKNQAFIRKWHYFLKDISRQLPTLPEDAVKQINMYLLNVFFVTLYEGGKDFYEQFERRLQIADQELSKWM